MEVSGAPITALGHPVVVCDIGDSIAEGQNSGGPNSNDHGIEVVALQNYNVPWRLLSKPSDRLAYQTIPADFRSKAQLLQGCTHFIIETVTNDFANGQTTAQVQANILLLGTQVAALGARGYAITMMPRVTVSSGAGSTLSGQTASSWESSRQTYNNWVRAGMPISPTTLQAVAVGTSGAITVGQAGHPFTGYIDYAAQVEVNSSNVPTVNGGFYFIGGGASSTFGTAGSVDGIHPTNYQQGAITSSISGNTLTVSAGTPVLGWILSGAGITGSPQILSGSNPTWTISGPSQGTVGSESMTQTPQFNAQALLAQAIAPSLFAAP